MIAYGLACNRVSSQGLGGGGRGERGDRGDGVMGGRGDLRSGFDFCTYFFKKEEKKRRMQFVCLRHEKPVRSS